jgi:hypothetical protein
MAHDHASDPISPMSARDAVVLQVANEFAAVEARVVRTRNGVRLRIRSVHLDSFIDLDPLALESLTWQPSSVFSAFLAKPFGD